MTIRSIIQEAINKDPVALKEAMEEELRTRIVLALQERLDEECDDEDENDEDDEDEDDEDELDEAATQSDLNANKKVVIHGVKGVRSKPFKKTFKNYAAFEKWSDSDEASDYEISHVQNESVLDEISKKTLGSYVRKASQSVGDTGYKLGNVKASADEVDRFTNRHMKDKHSVGDELKKSLGADGRSQNKLRDKITKRMQGIGRATDRLVK